MLTYVWCSTSCIGWLLEKENPPRSGACVIEQGLNLTLLPANLYNLPFASGDPKAFAQGFKREAGVFHLSKCENKAGAAPATVYESIKSTQHATVHCMGRRYSWEFSRS